MAYLECDIRDGLRPSEAAVTVADETGRKQRLRVERDFLRQEGDQNYLPVGIVGKQGGRVLIELPLEADSGANRLWVSEDQLLSGKPVPA